MPSGSQPSLLDLPGSKKITKFEGLKKAATAAVPLAAVPIGMAIGSLFSTLPVAAAAGNFTHTKDGQSGTSVVGKAMMMLFSQMIKEIKSSLKVELHIDGEQVATVVNNRNSKKVKRH